ncbi:leucine-rich repeat domain-containing protein [Marinoscillum sp.]|uniref:leucine-rich repeat domain-containing protein n=1 Tax=Marinoscillum sp. TaxID=2024838 RepID=UPI003BAA9FFD
MTKTRLKPVFIFLTFTLLIGVFESFGQENQTADTDEAYLSEVRGLVSFYQYMLNTVGSSKTPTRDKEAILTESYKKIFLNRQVQVEDDLLPDRNAITNKDVPGYLRDVDFFFQDISFSFEDVQITKAERENGKTYFLVSFQNTIEAITLEGNPFKNTSRRFLEVNVDEDESDLKIVSVYTTKISREKELRNWWENLSYGWTRIFKSYVEFDSISDEALFKIAAIDSINLSGNQMIQDIQPLAALKGLKVLDISNTKIDDLGPLRYAMKLEKLSALNTRLSNIDVLQYFENLRVLDLSQTLVQDITAIGGLTRLETLNLSGSNVIVFTPLKNLTGLKTINFSNTAFTDPEVLNGSVQLQQAMLSRTGVKTLSVLSGFKVLKVLDLSETYISSLAGLESHPALEQLYINQTTVNNLSPLRDCPKLKKVYADYTGVSEGQASQLMTAKPGLVVVINSEKVIVWWKNLPYDWKTVLTQKVGRSDPSKEDVIRLLNIDSLDVSNQQLVSSKPLEKFTRLRYLNVSKNLFTDLRFTAGMADLEFLVGEKLPIETLAGLEQNKNLKYIIVKGSLIQDIRSIQSLNKLVLVDADQSNITEDRVRAFLKVNPETVVIYQSQFLLSWWEELSDPWKKAFALNKVDAFTLHQLIESRSVQIENTPIASLRTLDRFINLKDISLSNTGVTSLIDLNVHEDIEQITCKNGPLMDLEGLATLQYLRSLDISNTAVDDLRPISENRTLVTLNCSGTNIKKLKGLEELYQLQVLNISNTRVWQLDRLYDISGLKSLICYNTRIRSHKIGEFKEIFPNCEVTFY